MHFHLLAPDGVFAETDARPGVQAAPRANRRRDLLAILDRVMRRVARRLDHEEPDGPTLADSPPELFAQLQTEAATTWRSPTSARRSRPSSPGTTRLAAARPAGDPVAPVPVSPGMKPALLAAVRLDLDDSGTVLRMLKSYADSLMHDPTTESGIRRLIW